MKEIWKPIPGYPGYEVSNIGNVRSYKTRRYEGLSKTPHVIKQFINIRGYMTVSIRANGSPLHASVHALVLTTFVGPRPNTFDACHTNGNKLDNRLENLRWDSRSENCRDNARIGIPHQKGEDSVLSKLTTDAVLEIKREYRRGIVEQKEFAVKFGVTEGTISKVITGRTWRHINPDSSSIDPIVKDTCK